mmetsp:Transcript_21920/g.35263  ORF Transcript_21920/g.35263 Transcript_21920/m.35263 type:complete len:519 (+) Transcript_21920:232-1788(+)
MLCHELSLAAWPAGDLCESTMAVSENLGIVAIARGIGIDLFALQGGEACRGRKEIRLPFLMSRPVESKDVRALMCMNTREEDVDLLVVVAGGVLFVYELSFRAWFRVGMMSAFEKESPVLWRLRYMCKIVEGARNLECFSLSHSKVSSSLFRICIATINHGVFIVEYHHFSSMKKQLENTKPEPPKRVFPQAGVLAQARSVSLGRNGVVLVVTDDGKLLQSATSDIILDKGAKKVEWLIPNQLFSVLLADGSQQIYEWKTASVQPRLEKTYPSLWVDKATSQWFIKPPQRIQVDGHHDQLWSLMAYSSPDSDLKAYPLKIGISKAQNDGYVFSELLDIVDAGFVNFHGSRCLGTYATAIRNCGKRKAANSTRNANTIAKYCSFEPFRDGIAVVILTGRGISMSCFTIPCQTPVKPAPPKLSQVPRLISKENIPATENKPSPPQKTKKTKHLQQEQLPKQSNLYKSVRALHTRVKKTELDLIQLRADFVTFTTNVTRSMDEVINVIENKARENNNNQVN